MARRPPMNRAVRRNLLLLCLIPLALGGLITVLALSPSGPPEAILGEEEYARISEERRLPENGIRALFELYNALKTLEEIPPCVPVEGGGVRIPQPFGGQPGSWEERTRVAAYAVSKSLCENNDPALEAYLESAESALAGLRSVVDSPVFLETKWGGVRADATATLRISHAVRPLLEMLILYHAHRDEGPDRFLEHARTHLALSRRLGASGAIYGTEPRYDIQITREPFSAMSNARTSPLRILPIVARLRAGRPGELERLQALLDEERAKAQADRQDVLWSYCMAVDDTLRHAAPGNTPIDMRVRRMFFDRQWRKESAFLREHLATIQSMLSGSFPPLATFIRDKGPFGRHRGWPPLLSVLRSQVEGEAWVDAVWLAVAVERYRAEKGAPPASLEDLAPAYVPEIPRNPVDESPWKYAVMPDGSYVIEPMDRYQFRSTNPSRLVDMPGDAPPPEEAAASAQQ